MTWARSPASRSRTVCAHGSQTSHEALLWLERLPEPPEVHAPEACPRTTVTQYVPVNDKTGPSTAPMHSLPFTHWGSVTPVAFDQHPKAKDKAAYQQEAAALIVAACERIGLPRPHEVILTPVSAHLGAAPAHACPRLRRKDGTERRHSHAILVFGEPVRGPVLLGAGRYRGYGFCRPMDATHD